MRKRKRKRKRKKLLLLLLKRVKKNLASTRRTLKRNQKKRSRNPCFDLSSSPSKKCHLIYPWNDFTNNFFTGMLET